MENPLGIDRVEPRLSWQLDCLRAGLRGQRQSACQILVASDRARLDADNADLWDSGVIPSHPGMRVKYAGTRLRSRMRCHWKVRVWDQDGRRSSWSEPASWSVGLLEAADWTARWLADHPGLCAFGQRPGIGTHVRGGQLVHQEKLGADCPWFRKTFHLSQRPVRATLYVSSLGFHEAYLNGRKIGTDILAPPLTDLNDSALYVTHDVGAMLTPGDNCLGLWLGRGWTTSTYYSVPRLPQAIAQLEVEFPDGGRLVVGSDTSWRTAPSNISLIGGWHYADFGGERVAHHPDAARWCMADYDESAWRAVETRPAERPALKAQTIPPTSILEEIEPVSLSQEPDGAWLVDMGRMVTGWFRFAGRAAPHGEVVVDYTEWGPRDRACLNQRDIAVADAAGEARFFNKFNYHTFQYVRIRGLVARPAAADIRACVVSTALTPAFSFASSSPLLGRIHRAVVNTFRANSVGGYLCDCPERERIGYGYGVTMDRFIAWHFVEGVPFMERLNRLFVDNQHDTGMNPTSAPQVDSHYYQPVSAPYIEVPGALHAYTGDATAIVESRTAAGRYLAYMESLCAASDADGLLDIQRIRERVPTQSTVKFLDYLGEWLGQVPFDPPVNDLSMKARTVFNNCILVINLENMARCLEAIGDTRAARACREAAARKRAAIHARHFRGESSDYGVASQTYLALPLLAEIPQGRERDAVLRALEAMIAMNGRFTSGDGGMHILLRALTALGRPDLVYGMLHRDDYPGYGFMANSGLSIWEMWQNDEPFLAAQQWGSLLDRSRSHMGYCPIGEWFINGLAGITVAASAAGPCHIRIRPFIPADLEWFEATWHSVHGPISVAWRKAPGALTLEVGIPPNATADLLLPAPTAANVIESGILLNDVPEIIVSDAPPSPGVSVRVGSGKYSFQCRP